MEPDAIEFWDDLPKLVGRGPEMRAGEPVIKDEKGNLTRTRVDDLVSNVEAYMELSGMTEDQAIEATIRDLGAPSGGAATIRKLLAYQDARLNQMQMS